MHAITLRAFVFLTFCLSLLFSPFCFADDDYVVGETYKVAIDELMPTQYSVSKKEIEFRVKTLEEKDDDGELKEYKEKKTGTAVIGPAGDLYLIDGHHFAIALAEFGHNKIYVEVIADLSALTKEDFWKRMVRKKWVYLKDNKGNGITTADLPKKLSGLKDDPYRGLAWMVRKCSGYNQLEIPFQEFQWAEYFRSRVSISTKASNAQWEKAVRKALVLAADDQASHLPGWHGHKASCADILSHLGDD